MGVPGRKTLIYFQRIAGIIILLCLAATFFYSAYSKSGIEIRHFRLVQNDNSFDSFQWTFLDLGITSIIASGIIARLMIGFELLLGMFLLFHIYLKRFTYPAVITILSIFIIYLLVVLVKQGNTGNCGCFGNQLEMTPLAAILKNIAMIAGTALLWFIYPPKRVPKETGPEEMINQPINPEEVIRDPGEGINPPGAVINQPRESRLEKFKPYIALLVATLAFCLPFIANNIYVGTDPDKYTQQVDFRPLYKYDNSAPQELMKGKHIIAFMSLTCPHCKKAAYLLQIIHRQHPDIPIFLVLDGPRAYEQKFFDETHAQDVPYLLFYGHSPDFASMAGSGVPSIYWVNNGVAEYKSTYAYYQLDPMFMEQWLKKK